MKSRVVHVRDEQAQWFLALAVRQTPVICARRAPDDQVTDRIVEKRNARLFEHVLRDRDHVLFAEGGSGLCQKLGQELVVARVHGARL